MALDRCGKSCTVYSVGHSLGGAQAALFAAEMRSQHQIEVRLTTFGCPRVGNAAWVDWAESVQPAGHRFTHNRDCIPMVPPTELGYRHMAREVWQTSENGTYTLCNDTGTQTEDPEC